MWMASEQESTLARSFGLVALVLFVLFVTGLGGSLFPLRLLNSVWQLQVVAALVSASLAPLLGLVLLRLALALDPRDPVLQGRWRFCSGLAVAASFGFLLLLPLHIQAGLRQNNAIYQAQVNRVRTAGQQLILLRRAVAEADSPEALNRGLRDLRGPVLSSADLAKPLPELKSQVGEAFNLAERELQRERRRLSPPSRLRLLPGALRIGVASLALSLGFASLAQRPGAPRSLLQELQAGLDTLLLRRYFTRLARRNRLTDQDYVRQLSGDDQGVPPVWWRWLNNRFGALLGSRPGSLPRARATENAYIRELSGEPESETRTWLHRLEQSLERLLIGLRLGRQARIHGDEDAYIRQLTAEEEEEPGDPQRGGR